MAALEGGNLENLMQAELQGAAFVKSDPPLGS